MADYVSNYSGDQIDEAVGRALPGGALDTGKAPAGFGLGEVTAKELPDANRAVESGYYQCSQNVPAVGWWYVHCISQYNESKTQYAFSVEAASGITRGTVCKRYMNAGTWGEWEYINPPMRLGVEYRTTERYLGKPVYVKKLEVACPAANSSVRIAIGADSIKFAFLDMSLCMYYRGTTGENKLTNPDFCKALYIDNGEVAFIGGADAPGTGYLHYVVKYTKSTD